MVDHLAARGQWTWSRPSGPGGQRRDHVETRASLAIDVAALAGLPPEIAARLTERLGLERRPLRLRSQRERSRELNRLAVMSRLAERVAAALAPPARKRRPTRPRPAAVRRVRAAKKHRSALKRTRSGPLATDD